MISAILCHHKGDFIYRAVSTLLQSKDVEFEIIIVSSNYNLKIKGARVVYMTGGPAGRRNYGATFASGEYFAFFDDDVEVDFRCLWEMQKVINRAQVGMVFGKTLNMEHRTRFDEAGSYLTWTGFLYARSQSGIEDVGQFEKVEPVLAGKSASCMIRKEIFYQVGLFDASYEILAEETDLAWRVWLAGHEVLYVPQSVAYHAFNTRFKPFDYYTHQRVYFNGCRNYLAMLTTNLGGRRLCIALPLQLIAWVLCGIGMMMTGKFRASFYIGKGLFYYFTHLGSHLEKRQRIQKNRKIEDDLLVKKIMKNPSFDYFLKRFLSYLMTGLHG